MTLLETDVLCRARVWLLPDADWRAIVAQSGQDHVARPAKPDLRPVAFFENVRMLRDHSAIKLALAALVTIGMAMSSHQSFAQSMSLPGQLDISSVGSAEYKIPIGVPPGTAGMTPSLSLEYDSQSPNGLLGVGWNLKGLPSIARCMQTVAQDGVDLRLAYTNTDRFCMEGQRLVPISGGNGADDTEYRFEIEGFTKIKSYGDAGGGPAWFEVKTKSGQTLQIGNTTDSRILAQGQTFARAWTVNRITDTKGNYLTVTYTPDVSLGHVYPSRIDYTGNAAAGVQPYNSVQFEYETRTDAPLLYSAAYRMQLVQRLSRVKSYAGATLVSEYRFTYEYSPSTADSRLTSITLCDGAGVCLPATNFAYSGTNYMAGGVMGYSVNEDPLGLNTQLVNYQPTISDFNGDGLQDLFWDKTDSYGRTVGNRELWLSNDQGGFQRIQNVMGLDGTWGTGLGSSTFKRFVGDFNGDLRADILWVQVSTAGVSNGTAAGSLVLWTSNSDGTFQIANLASPNIVPTGFEPLLADFTADGRTDIFWRNKAAKKRNLWLNTGGQNGTFDVFNNIRNRDGQVSIGSPVNSCSYTGSTAPVWDPYERIFLLADFEGDGRSDVFAEHLSIFTISTGKCYVARIAEWRKSHDNSGVQFALGQMQQDCWDPTAGGVGFEETCPYQSASVIPADFNGDGKDDLYWQGLDWRVMWMSTGKWPSNSTGASFGPNATLSPDSRFRIFTNLNGQNGQSTFYTPFLFDFNADGKTDIMFSNPGNTSRYLWLSEGDGSFTTVPNVAGQNGVKPGTIAFVGDFNGDGKADLLWDDQDSVNRSKGTRKLWMSDGVPSDLLSTITDGLGNITTISYKPLSSGGPLYVKDTNAAYPLMDVQGPLYVVSRVDTADGIGGIYSVTFSYAGAKADHNGRGFLGFRERIKTDLRTNIVETTTHRQDFPYLTVISEETKKLGAQLLNKTVNTYSATNLGGTRNFVAVSQSVASSWDLDGTPMPSATTDFQYDAFGNPTQIVVTGSDGTVRTTINTYTNDTLNWYLGRLTRASVTNTIQ